MEDALKGESYDPLDPSRGPQTKETYKQDCKCLQASQDIRFSHGFMSSCFRHGEHKNAITEQLMREIEHEERIAMQIPALVCIDYSGAYRVIMGNRRLCAY